MLSRHYHLAQVNIARLLAPLVSPALADFVAQLAPVNALADRSPGFVWRLQDATSVRPYDDPMILPNLSVWDSVEALKEFAYRSGHVVPLRDRARWFERPQQAHLALWWIPAGADQATFGLTDGPTGRLRGVTSLCGRRNVNCSEIAGVKQSVRQVVTYHVAIRGQFVMES